MTERFTTRDGNTIFYDNGSVVIHNTEALNSEKAEIEKRIQPLPSDEELLEWARENFVGVNYEEEKKRLAEIDAILAQIADVAAVQIEEGIR